MRNEITESMSNVQLIILNKMCSISIIIAHTRHIYIRLHAKLAALVFLLFTLLWCMLL